MRYLSVCSGIEAASVAWEPLGWTPVAFAEVDKFASAVLKARYPDVPNVGDFTGIKGDEFGTVDVLVGGTPCQDFSVAGLRAGMDGKRGQLTVEFARLAGRLRSRWLVWENVPGVLSADGGRAFGTFLGLLGELGYGFAYRVLDAQYLGVPQRRRRVFVVGCLGDWRSAAAVLFERHSLSGHPAPRREARQGPAGTLKGGSGERGYPDPSDGNGGGLIAGTLQHSGKAAGSATQRDVESGMLLAFGGNNTAGPIEVAAGLNADRGAHNPGDFETGTLMVEVCPTLRAGKNETGGDRPTIAFSCKDHGADVGELAPTLRGIGHDQSHANAGGQVAIGFQSSQSGVREVEAHATLDSNNGSRRQNGVVSRMAVRRLTPRECERLQGFPDDWTLIGAKTADGPRYRVLGNSMAVPCMRWIGERMQQVEEIRNSVECGV